MSKRKAIIKELTLAAQRASSLIKNEDVPEAQKEWAEQAFRAIIVSFDGLSTAELEGLLVFLKRQPLKTFNQGQVLRQFAN